MLSHRQRHKRSDKSKAKREAKHGEWSDCRIMGNRRRTVKAVPPLEGGNRESVGEGGRQGKKERARRTEEQSQAGGNLTC